MRVERQDPRLGWVTAADDQGVNLGIIHHGKDKTGDGHTYAAHWYNPWLGAGRLHRFVLPTNGGRPELASEPFD